MVRLVFGGQEQWQAKLQIFIKTLKNRSNSRHGGPFGNYQESETKDFDKEGVPVNEQRLNHIGKELQET